jgi:deazaflavin-dependent oxidoreductase (nitroreductase family)
MVTEANASTSPAGRALVLRILRSRAHLLLSRSAIELMYTGRRTGRRYALPVQYARQGDWLVVLPQGAQQKTWWRNFMNPRPVTVRLRGRLREGTARVIQPGEPTWERWRTVYERRWRRFGGKVTGPLVQITLDDEAQDSH